MEQGGGERTKRIEWVSSVVDVGDCSHFAHFIASIYASSSLKLSRFARSPQMFIQVGSNEA